VPLNAVPSDRLSSSLIEPNGDLYLRPGKYALTWTAADSHVLFRQDIRIPQDSNTSSTEPSKPAVDALPHSSSSLNPPQG